MELHGIPSLEPSDKVAWLRRGPGGLGPAAGPGPNPTPGSGATSATPKGFFSSSSSSSSSAPSSGPSGAGGDSNSNSHLGAGAAFESHGVSVVSEAAAWSLLQQLSDRPVVVLDAAVLVDMVSPWVADSGGGTGSMSSVDSVFGGTGTVGDSGSLGGGITAGAGQKGQQLLGGLGRQAGQAGQGSKADTSSAAVPESLSQEASSHARACAQTYSRLALFYKDWSTATKMPEIELTEEYLRGIMMTGATRATIRIVSQGPGALGGELHSWPALAARG